LGELGDVLDLDGDGGAQDGGELGLDLSEGLRGDGVAVVGGDRDDYVIAAVLDDLELADPGGGFEEGVD